MYSRTRRKIYLIYVLPLLLAAGFSFADYQDQANGCRITRCFINPQVPIATPECRTSINNLFKQRVRNTPQCPESESSGTYLK